MISQATKGQTMDINRTELEAQIKSLMWFIENEMKADIEVHGPWFAVGYLRRGIEMLSEELERAKARELVAR